MTYAGPPDRPSDAWRLHPSRRVGTRCRLARTPGRPPQTSGLRAGDGLARGRGVFETTRGTWRDAAIEYGIDGWSLSVQL